MSYFRATLFLFLCFSIPAVAKYQTYPSQIYYLSFPNLPKGEVAFINGMNHKPDRAVKCSMMISELAGRRNVYTVYNPTSGVFGDLKKCYHELFRFKISEPVSKLHEKWDSFFALHPKHVKYLQFCHSEGSIQVRNALARYPHELRKRIIVIAIAPAAYISDEICHHTYHYVSRRDIVPYFDRLGRKICKDSIIRLTPHPEARFFDHHFLSPTYRDAITHHLKEYLRENGIWEE